MSTEEASQMEKVSSISVAEPSEESQSLNVTVTDRDKNPTQTGAAQQMQEATANVPEHPQAAAIRRQVEYYFSDENLPSDKHMLEKCGGAQNLPVSIRHIHGFARMRKYKPYRAVVNALKSSAFLDVVDDKYVKRKVPLLRSALEDDSDDEPKKPAPVVPDQPWMTKGMLKPTGFEEYWTDPPVTPAAFAEERRIYDPEVDFSIRIEVAIQRYKQRRKFHSETADAFNKWLKFGGIERGQKQFTGKVDQETLDQYDAMDIALVNATHHVGDKDDKTVWAVDFEGVAKAYLSSQFPIHYFDYGEKEVKLTTSVMRNFYNYILHHDVCVEYAEDIYAARKVCDAAEKELPAIKELGTLLPGSFNCALSALSEGYHCLVASKTRSWTDEGDGGTNDKSLPESQIMFNTLRTACKAYRYEHVLDQVVVALDKESRDSTVFECIQELRRGLEVTKIDFADEAVQKYYEQLEKTGQSFHRVGMLHCRAWEPPSFEKYDLPKSVVAKRTLEQRESEFRFWVEEHILHQCFVGMKMEATTRKLRVGIEYMDRLHMLYCSFYTVIPNELMKDWKEVKWLTSDRQVKEMQLDEEKAGHDD